MHAMSSLLCLICTESRLLRDLASTETRYEERLQRLREELQSLQAQLAELKRGESSLAAGSKQVSALESVLKQERDDKDKALGLVAKLKDECDLLTKDLYLVKKDLASQRAAVAQVCYVMSCCQGHLLLCFLFLGEQCYHLVRVVCRFRHPPK